MSNPFVTSVLRNIRNILPMNIFRNFRLLYKNPLLIQDNKIIPLQRFVRGVQDLGPSGTSFITSTQENFQICLDVQQYSPKDVIVKTKSNTITIEGKHEQQKNEKVTTARFLRRYELSEGYDFHNIKSVMTSDGCLTVTIPKIFLKPPNEERIIPIMSKLDGSFRDIKKIRSKSIC